MKRLICLALTVAAVFPAMAETTSTVHNGVYAAQVSRGAAGGDTGLDRQDAIMGLDVTPGTTVTLSFWARNGQTAASTFDRVALVFFTSGGAYINPPGDVNNFAGTAVPEEWTEYTAPEVLVPATAAKMNVSFRVGANSSIVIDDVSVLSDNGTATTEIVTNGGFEDWPGNETSSPTDWRFFNASGTGTFLRLDNITRADSDWLMAE